MIFGCFLKQKKEEEKEDRKKTHNERIIKAKKISDIRTLFEQREDYYKSERVRNIWNNNHIEYESKIYSSSDKFLFLSLW